MKKWILGILSAVILLVLFMFPLLAQKKEHVQVTKAKKQQNCEVFIQVEGQAKPMPLEEYLVGVVAGEMPVSFHEEALKAQAIAARTYVLKSTEGGKKPISPTVSRQVYVDKEKRMANWGNYFSGNESKIREILEQTKGKVMFYNGELITAMFHSMSNGHTESAKGFSGNEVPYLHSVDSNWEKVLPNFTQKKTLTIQQWEEIFGLTSFDQLQLVRNTSGRVDQMVTNKGQWQGRQVRDLLDLRSTDFDVAYDAATGLVSVITRGYGHGVGMSQYGADAMAKAGKSAEDILKHYYQSVEISLWKECLK